MLAHLGAQRIISDTMVRQFLGEFDAENVPRHTLRRMRRDWTIKMALHYSKAPLVRADYEIQCEDPAIQAAVKENVDNIYGPWMRSALNMFDFGFQACVKQYELGKIDATYEGPSGDVVDVWKDEDVLPVVIGKPIPIPPEHATVELKKGRFDGINTTLEPISGNDTNMNHVPVEWSLWFVNEFEEEFGNWYGYSRIAPAYPLWWAYWMVFMMRNRHAENDADPALQVWYPPGSYPDPDDATKTKTNRDAALEIGAQLRGGATIAWPSDVHISEDGKATPQKLWEASFLTGGENLGAFNDLLGDLKADKLRACLVPEQALIESPAGQSSRNSAATYVDIFIQTLEQTARNLDEIWNKYQIRPMVEANWGKDAPPVKKVTTGFQEEDMALASALIQGAMGADPNALPIDWEELLRRAAVPMLSKKEQQERDDAVAQMQEEQQALADEQAAAGQPPPPDGIGTMGGETPEQLAASQQRSGPRKYERERIHLSGNKSTAPTWARIEGRRRDHNLSALSERLHDVAFARYEDAFAAAAEALADAEPGEITQQLALSVSAAEDLELGIRDAVDWIVGKVMGTIKDRTTEHHDNLQGELASMYHAAGLAEATRLGLSGESWDVGRDEVQEWARFRAGELVKTIDKTVVESHIRPWLTAVLQDPHYAPTFMEQGQGIPVDSMELAAQLSDHFSAYPHWMSERLVRTEVRIGYNEAAAEMWRRVGVDEVTLFDGLGGRTGQTDEECLRRNGQTVTVDEFLELNAREHPNGTLGAVPVTQGVQLQPLNPGVLVASAKQSRSIYGVTDAGYIMTQTEVGRALADE